MECYQIGFIVAVFLMLWIVYTNNSEGFVNNDSFFNEIEKNNALEEYLIQPRLIHKINIPTEW